MELKLDATITVLLISKLSSTCFWQTFAHLQERSQTQIKRILEFLCAWPSHFIEPK
jgi:hypothetical protein